MSPIKRSETETPRALIAIDPGVHMAGVACFEDSTLVWAELMKGTGDGLPEKLRQALIDILGGAFEDAELAIEVPQAYHRHSSQKGDQNDLIALAFSAGEMAGRLCLPTTRYLPREWKGQAPKDVVTARTRARLTEVELSRIALPAKSLQHNVWDAIEIGLHHLGR